MVLDYQAAYDLGRKDGLNGNERFTSLLKAKAKNFEFREDYMDGYDSGSKERSMKEKGTTRYEAMGAGGGSTMQ